ncbi:MAG: hypothetical protein ACOYM0_01265 [Bacteroidales bacterium]
MSHTCLEEIFARFSAQFPPEDEYKEQLTLRLTTHDVVQIFCDFYPEIDLPDMYEFMTSHGYQYRAIEQNDTIKLCWLIKRS